MARADNNGTVLEYDTLGDRSDPAMLLIMGLTAQMTAWDDDFRQALADQGLFIIRFDNRDCGLSSKTDAPVPDLMALMTSVMAGNPVTADVPYDLSDMASDAIAVLDDLGIERQLQVDQRCDTLAQGEYVGVLNVAPILAQVAGDALRARALRRQGPLDRIGKGFPTCLSQGCDVVDVDVQAQHVARV